MSVYDLKGKLVYKSVLDKSDLDNLTFGSEFPEGLYQLVCQDDNGRIERFKLFKTE